jgi:uncharacterized protein (DUF362 family)
MFLAGAVGSGIGLTLLGCGRGPRGAASAGNGRLASRGREGSPIEAATGPSAPGNVRAAVKALGGMKRFVQAGDRVVLKPNIAWARTPAQGANTSPEVIVAVAELCLAAGAASVLVIDHTIDAATATLDLSGIKAAVAALRETELRAGSAQSQYVSVSVPRGVTLKDEQVLKDVIGADVLINLPTAKVHDATTVSLGLKNMMGAIWNRQAWHAGSNLHQCIADFATAVQPDLIILDATRALLSNGPKGPGRMGHPQQIIAGTDPVAVDAHGVRLLGFDPERVEHLTAARDLGLGSMDLQKTPIESA